MRQHTALVVLLSGTLLCSRPALAQFSQQGPKLLGTGAVGTSFQGYAVSVSADGNTAIIGGLGDNNSAGAAWIWTRSGGVWTQQGPKLVGTGAVGNAEQGLAVSISADGNTAIVGGPFDNNRAGAAWIWTRSGGVWTQQGPKLVGSGAVGSAFQGGAVSLSADGNTAIVGAESDNFGAIGAGAAWVWTRSGGVWTQQGPKLVGSGAVSFPNQGRSVAIAADGNTAIVGGYGDNSNTGAAWVWTRTGGVWTQQGPKLVGTGAVAAARQGNSVSLSADGNTAIVGGFPNSDVGAAWVWTRSGGVWTQQGPKLVGAGAVGNAKQGSSVSLSADGNIAVVGGADDNNFTGAAWVWTRSGGVWAQQGNKLVGSGAVPNTYGGNSVSLSAAGNTAIVGGYGDNGLIGTAWVFTAAVAPTVVTGVASGITTAGATLNATANPNSAATTGNFEYGLTTAYGNITPVQSLGSGNVAVSIGGGGITGLLCGALYHFRGVATNTVGTTNGSDATFTTSACPTPTVVTGMTTAIGISFATLNGTVNPNGNATEAFFNYSSNPSFTTSSNTPVQAMGSGTSTLPIGGGSITGLTCSTTYYVRAIATAGTGGFSGGTTTFVTGLCPTPTTLTGFASNFNATGATLNGTVNPNGNAAVARFEYGLTTSYGSMTPDQNLAAGTSFVAIGGGAVSGLTCDAVYHFRATATNMNGTTTGPDATFSPPCAVPFDARLYAVVNNTSAAVVLNATTLATVATIPLPVASNYDVAVMPNQSLAFVARTDGIWVIDLTQTPPALATGINPIPKPIALVEDLSLTADGRFMVVTDGEGFTPIGVIDTASRTAVGTFNVLPAHNSVEVCDNGSVLVTSIFSGAVKRLTISATGMLTDTGQSLAVSGPFNVTCAPGGMVGITVDSTTNAMRSFLINGMTLVSTQVLPGDVNGFPINVAISRDGTRVFGRRSTDFLNAYTFNSTTGVIGAQLWSTNVGIRQTIYGTDMIAVHPNGSRVYASSGGFVFSLNASNGGLNGSAVMANPTGIALRHAVPWRGDFDGDAKGDLLLRHTVTGQNIGWLMDGLTVSTAAFMPTIADTNWRIVGRGDFDGDGKADVLLRNAATGQDIGWLMNGLTVSTAAFMPTIADTNWEIKGVGDLDRDGKADVILRNKSSGQDIGWLMNGLTVSSAAFMPTIADTNWEIVGVGDFDGDGRSDVILRNKMTGQNIGWLMNGLTISSAAFLPTIADTNWEIKGVGDLDGDGKADVILRNKATGQNIGWLMNGLAVSTSAFLPTIADTNWEIKGVGEFDGGGKADVILRNSVTGQNIGWLMNGLTVSTAAFMPTIADTNWEFVGQGQ